MQPRLSVTLDSRRELLRDNDNGRTVLKSHPSSSLHLLAGGSGGFATAILTAPLDVHRTRLQSNLQSAASVEAISSNPLTRAFQPFRSFTRVVQSIAAREGYAGFFLGLVPSMAGVVSATATKLYTYGTCKTLFASLSGRAQEEAAIHASAAIAAGMATASVTNPIWMIKTRLQLDQTRFGPNGRPSRQYRNTIDCIRQVARQEGIKSFYRGLTASYVGSTETVLHLVLYERLKRLLDTGNPSSEATSWATTTGAAGTAKAAAVLVAYPHEVIRTRMRQVPTRTDPVPYTSFVSCGRTVWLREGLSGLYGGLIPHVLRSIPSAMNSLGVYESFA